MRWSIGWIENHSRHLETPAKRLDRQTAAQLEILRASLEAHPLKLLADQIAKPGAITTAEVAERIGQS